MSDTKLKVTKPSTEARVIMSLTHEGVDASDPVVVKGRIDRNYKYGIHLDELGQACGFRVSDADRVLVKMNDKHRAYVKFEDGMMPLGCLISRDDFAVEVTEMWGFEDAVGVARELWSDDEANNAHAGVAILDADGDVIWATDTAALHFTFGGSSWELEIDRDRFDDAVLIVRALIG